MAVTSGFFNSDNGDRKYNARDLTSMFDGIILNGVLSSIGTSFVVKPSSGTTVTVGIGKAWYMSSFIKNDAILPLDMGLSDVLLPRYDAIVLEFNNSLEVRENTIKIIQGTVSSTPIKPAMIKTQEIEQYPICYILRNANSVDIVDANIENTVGTSENPFVTGLLQQITIDQLLTQWGGEFNVWWDELKADFASEKALFEQWMSESEQEFNVWFNNIKGKLSGDLATALQTQIDDIENGVTMVGLANNGIFIYLDSDDGLSGTPNALNIKFKANTSRTISAININTIPMTIVYNDETSIDVEEGRWYEATVDYGDNTVNFKMGGTGLDIKVVGGTTRPVSPKENTIWVNTNLNLNFKTFKIGYNYPTTPQLNDVFVFISDSDLVYSYADKNKQIKIGLLNVYYYDGSKWVLLIFETYADNQWHSATILYYNYGLTTFPFSFGGGAFDGGTYLGVRKIQSQSAFSAAVTYTSSKVDVTKLKTLNITVQFIKWTTVAKNYDFMTLGLVSTIGSTFDYNNPVFAKQIVSRQESTRVYSIDVSTMSGNYHICAKALGYAGTTHFNVTKIEGLI